MNYGAQFLMKLNVRLTVVLFKELYFIINSLTDEADIRNQIFGVV